MPGWVKSTLLFLAVEAVHFLLFTFLMFVLGFFGSDGLSRYTDILRYGVVDFWLSWPGQIILLCFAVVVVWCFWDLLSGWLALKKRTALMDEEVKARLVELAVEQERRIIKQVLDSYSWQKEALETEMAKLERGQSVLASEKEFLNLQFKTIESYKEEMQAIRKKAAAAKERQVAVKNSIRWAQEALNSAEPNIGLAVRLLRKALKS